MPKKHLRPWWLCHHNLLELHRAFARQPLANASFSVDCPLGNHRCENEFRERQHFGSWSSSGSVGHRLPWWKLVAEKWKASSLCVSLFPWWGLCVDACGCGGKKEFVCGVRQRVWKEKNMELCRVHNRKGGPVHDADLCINEKVIRPECLVWQWSCS